MKFFCGAGQTTTPRLTVHQIGLADYDGVGTSVGPRGEAGPPTASCAPAVSAWSIERQCAGYRIAYVSPRGREYTFVRENR